MASTDKDEERRDHFWSRKPPEERRPLSDLSRLLFNAPEWQHPFKLVAIGFAVFVAFGMIWSFAALSSGSDGGVKSSNRGRLETPVTERAPATLDKDARMTQSFCDLVRSANWALGNPNVGVEVYVEYLKPVRDFGEDHGSRLPAELRRLSQEIFLQSNQANDAVVDEMARVCVDLGFPPES